MNSTKVEAHMMQTQLEEEEKEEVKQKTDSKERGEETARKRALEAILSQKDFVMDERCIVRLKEYVLLNGEPSMAVEFLSANYRGYAQMTSLVCAWLKIAQPSSSSGCATAAHGADVGGVSNGATTSPAKTKFKKFEDYGFKSTGDDDEDERGLRKKMKELTPQGGVNIMNNNNNNDNNNNNNNNVIGVDRDSVLNVDLRAGENLAGGGLNNNNNNNVIDNINNNGNIMMMNSVIDEIGLLERLIEKEFDAAKADAVFDKFKGKPPAWLEKIFRSERGRALLFKLADKHSNCLLIDLAIQHAWRAGLRREVRALGSAASAYFGVFHELLADHFSNLCESVVLLSKNSNTMTTTTTTTLNAGELEDKISIDTNAIKEMCTRTIGAYMFAQILLSDIVESSSFTTANKSWNAVVKDVAKRFSQDLEIAASEKHGVAAVRRIATALNVTSIDADVASAVSDALQAAGKPVGGLSLGSSSFLGRKRLRSGGSMHNSALVSGNFGGSAVLAAASTGGSAKRALAAWDLKKILGKYRNNNNNNTSESNSNRSPSAAPLRRPDALRAMFDEAFQFDKNIDQLLHAFDSNNTNNAHTSTNSNNEIENSATGLCVEILALATAEDLNDKALVDSARKDLVCALQICSNAAKTFDNDSDNNSSMDNMKLSPVEFLEKYADAMKTLETSLPATAGVVTWIESAIRRDPEKSHKIAFALLEKCALAQISLHSRCLECVSTAIEVAGRGCGDEIPKAAIDFALSLLEIGAETGDEELILDCLDECSEVWTTNHIDQLHIKRFISEFLDFASPPYSRQFTIRVLRALHSSRSKKGSYASIDCFLEEVRVKKREFKLGRNALEMLEFACTENNNVNNNYHHQQLQHNTNNNNNNNSNRGPLAGHRK
jgi:negative elongation factor C/D